MTYLVRDGWWLTTRGDPLHVSPDGRYFFFMTRQGDLSDDSNVYRLKVFDAAAVRQALDEDDPWRVEPLLVYSLRSRTHLDYTPGISAARWLPDSRAIAFLGSEEETPPQIFRLDIPSGRVSKLTSQQYGVDTFEISADVAIYQARAERRSSDRFENSSATFVDRFDYAEILGGIKEDITHDFIVDRDGSTRDLGETRPVLTGGFDSYWLAPRGRRYIALRQIPSEDWPRFWQTYGFDGSTPSTSPIYQFFLEDPESGSSKLVLDAPVGLLAGNSAAPRAIWAPDSTRVLLVNTLLPLSAKQAAKDKSTSYIVEYIIASGSWSVVAELPPVATGQRVEKVRWHEPGRSLLVSFRSAADARTGPPKGGVLYIRNRGGWRATAAPRALLSAQSESALVAGVTLNVEESAHQPPRIVARRKQRELTLEIVANIPRDLALSRVQGMTWTDRRGKVWHGGLMMPTSADSTPKPLVILAYYYEPDRFLPDGGTTTAFAAQPLAAEGFAVLQLRRMTGETEDAEAPGFVEGIDTIVEDLAGTGAIDATRVGIVGFSRTGWLTNYLITHPGRTRIAAAISADPGEPSYMQYLQWAVLTRSTARTIRQYESRNGGGTFWANKSGWLERAIGFNLDRVTTPLLLSLPGKHNVILGLETFAGLKLLEKPVDLILFPKGEHQLVRPRERLASLQTTVDWMKFWLLEGDLGDDEQSKERYSRWTELRKQHQRLTSKAPASR